MHAVAPYPAPPPTFNTLDSRQRTRLIRSTRKLGAVLGTTPQLAETAQPISPSESLSAESPVFVPRRDRKRRQGSVFEFPPPAAPFSYDYMSSSANSSASSLALPRGSLESTDSGVSTQSLPNPKSFARHVRDKSQSHSKGKRRAPLPTPLVLRLNAVPLPPSDPRVQPPVTPDTAATIRSGALTVDTPLASVSASGVPVTPTTPRTPATPTATETRRKRLAKLKRTLGENVPPELVMPFRSLRAFHSSSSSSSPSPVDPPAMPPARQQEREQQKTLPLARFGKTARRRSASVDYQTGLPSSASPAHLAGFAAVARPLPQAPRALRSLRSPEFAHAYADEAGTSRESSPGRRSSKVWVTGNGAWTGEWNRRDIQEVQHQLRNLRLR